MAYYRKSICRCEKFYCDVCWRRHLAAWKEPKVEKKDKPPLCKCGKCYRCKHRKYMKKWRLARKTSRMTEILEAHPELAVQCALNVKADHVVSLKSGRRMRTLFK